MELQSARLLQKILFFLVFCLFHSGETIKQCANGNIVGMASPASMTGGWDIRQTYGRGYIMTNQAYVSQCCGAVKGWTFGVDRRALANPVELYVWRPVEGRNFSRLWLVGKHHFYAEAASYYSDEEDDDDDDEYEYEDSGGSRERSVFVPEGHRISIIPGDVIGWRSPEGDVISYTSRYYNPDNVIVNRMEEMEVGTAHVFPAPVTSHRTYGINAVLTSSAAPVIINLPARVNMYADVTKGSAVFNVTGYDENIGDVVMYLLPNNEDDDKANDLPFDIEPISGRIFLSGELQVTSYDVSVVMTDSCGLYDVKMLSVVVTSSGSSRKEKVILPDTLAIPVSDVTRDYSYTVFPSDDDIDDVICIITDVTPFVSLFSMKGTVLHVKISNESSFDLDTNYSVTVTCFEEDFNFTQIVIIRLFYHKPPIFVNMSAAVRVSARDAKAGDVIHVVIVTSLEQLPLMFWGNGCECPFHVHPDGSLAVTRSLMSEPVTSYSIDVFVNDSVVTAGPSMLHIILTDINHAPVFTNVPPLVLMEENSSGVVLVLSVSDADGDAIIFVSVEWIPEQATTYLLFNETAGSIEIIIRPSSNLDFEHLDAVGLTHFVVKVTASDGYKTSSVNVTLVVTDVNEPPECFQAFFYVIVDEGTKGNTASDGTFLTSSCSDPESRQLRYVITESSNNNPFVMNSHDAILIYKENVDVIDTTLTSLLVTVSDVAGLSIDVTVDVEILNVFKKPKILNLPRKIAVSEDVPPGKIFSIETVDEDFGEENLDVYFRVLNGDPELFELQGKNFHLRYPRRLNYERTPLHLIEFIADNGHVASDNVTLTLEVVDVNEAPGFFESIFYVTVEDAEAGTIILPDLRKIVADSDLDDTITFSLSSSQETFRINPVSGTISLVADYDVDHDVMTSDVILIVKAVDSGLLSATAEVNVKIVYKNERPRILNLPREITVPEDLKGDRVVYRVVGEDPDDDDVTLRMSVMDGDGRLFSFNESDGTVTIKQTARLDFETQSTFTFRFFADDGNLTSSPEILTLRISDVNEAPYFTRDILYISTSEGPAGTTISDAGIFSSAKDPENDTLTFDLLPSPRASGFSVDTESAEVMFAVDFVLTRQSSPVSVYLTIRVRDSGNLTATARLKITIHDVNTRPSLLYLPANITIHKPMPQGTLLYTAHAEDKDNDTLLFRLNVLQGGRRDLFHFNSTSGELSLAKGMTSPQITFFSLEISVTDGLLSSQAALVTIFVLGDAKPAVVTSDPYVITVREDELVYPIPLPDDLFIENSLSTVIAEYSISGGTGQDYLLIDSATGDLVFARSYDIDDPYVNSTLTLEITQSNSGDRVKKTVQVEVVDVNDNAPEVTSDLLTWFVDKAIVIETVIGQIEARDRDGGKNGELDYEIVSADSVPLDLFRINSNGEVIVNKPLSWVKTSLTKLQVVVSDGGHPPLTTTVGVFLVFS